MTNKQKLLLFLILIVAFIFRYAYLEIPALTSDEGDLRKSVDKVLKEGALIPWQHWGGLTPPLTAWGASFFAMILGINELSLRIFSALSGVLTVIAIYALARLHYGTNVALNAALLSAITPLLVLSNRYGPADSPLLLFTILTIFCWEYGEKNKLLWPYIIGGILAGLTIITKYNAVIIFSIYWLTILIINTIGTQQRRTAIKEITKKIALTGALATIVLFLSFGGKAANAIYFIHGILFWTVNQNLGTATALPWHYSLAILFDGLSPLLFTILPIAGIIVLFKHSRENIINFVLCFALIATVMAGTRKFPRHFLLAIPFAIIIISNAFEILRKKIDINNAITAALIILVLSTGWWSLHKIEDYKQNVAERELGAFILENTTQNTAIFANGQEYWSLRYYTKDSRQIHVLGLKNSLLKDDDIIIIKRMNITTPFFIGSALQNDLTLYNQIYGAQYDFNTDIIPLIKKHGILLKTLDYDSLGNKIEIYKIKQINKAYKAIQKPFDRKNLDPMTRRACEIWQSENTASKLMHKAIPHEIQKKMTEKCTKGCADTCSLF